MTTEEKKEYAKQRYYAKREEILQKSKQRYEKDKEIIKERHRNWLKENPNYMKLWKANNKEYVAEYDKTYHKTYNKTQMGRALMLVKDYRQNDRKYKRGNIDFDAKWIVDNIFSSTCVYCGESDWTKLGCDRKDNSKPHTKDNVVCSCFKCNAKKGSLSYDEYIKRLGKKT